MERRDHLEAVIISYNPDKHHRRSIRLKGYDYEQAGAYYQRRKTSYF